MIFSRYILLTAVLSIFLISCGKKELKEYYFPLKKLKEQPKVYEYAYSTGDTTFSIYWYYQTVVKADTINFVGTCYNDNYEVMILFTEEMVKNGMKLKSLSYYGINREGKAIESRASIEGGAVYPFEVTDDKSVFINVIKYSDPKDSLHTTTLTRNRRFLRETSYSFKDKQYAAAEFEMKEEQADADPKKGGWSRVFTIQEIYAKGIGLVYSKRDLGSGAILESRLKDIITMAELEERFKKHIEK